MFCNTTKTKKTFQFFHYWYNKLLTFILDARIDPVVREPLICIFDDDILPTEILVEKIALGDRNKLLTVKLLTDILDVKTDPDVIVVEYNVPIVAPSTPIELAVTLPSPLIHNLGPLLQLPGV